MKLGLGRNLSIPRRSNNVDPKLGAHTFNGTSTKVELTNGLGIQDFTVMFWAKPNYSATSVFIDMRSGGFNGMTIQMTSSSTVIGYYHSTKAVTAGITNGAWNHIAYTANTGTERLTPVINGAAQADLDITGVNIAASIGQRIGYSIFSSGFYRGQMAQMAIFNTALSAATISGLMNKTYSQLSAGDKTNLVSWWALTNISGTSVPDLHGTNTGTLTP